MYVTNGTHGGSVRDQVQLFSARSNMTVRRLFLAASLLSVLGGCSVPFLGSGGDKKSECDRIAAEAIQTKDVMKARELAAGASGCYAKLSQ
jgi:hypothetical protein